MHMYTLIDKWGFGEKSTLQLFDQELIHKQILHSIIQKYIRNLPVQHPEVLIHECNILQATCPPIVK